jgi:multidrug efflux pump subunit AcrA (membrane-fusion protein)
MPMTEQPRLGSGGLGGFVSAAGWLERAKRMMSGRAALAVALAAGLLLLAPGLARLDPAPSVSEADAAPASLAPAEAPAPAALPDPSAAGSARGADEWFGAQDTGAAAGPSDPGGYECLLEPSARAAIGSPVIARIDRVLVERADKVEAGQVVVELDSAVEHAAVQVASARASMQGALRSREASAELEARRRERAERLFDQRRSLSTPVKRSRPRRVSPPSRRCAPARTGGSRTSSSGVRRPTSGVAASVHRSEAWSSSA